MFIFLRNRQEKIDFYWMGGLTDDENWQAANAFCYKETESLRSRIHFLCIFDQQIIKRQSTGKRIQKSLIKILTIGTVVRVLTGNSFEPRSRREVF